MLIRAAQADDAKDISQLLTGSWHRTYDAFMGVERVNEITASLHAPDVLVAEINDSSILTLVAVDEGGTVTGVVKIETRNKNRETGELYLDRLHIAPDAFGTGLADQLLNAAIAASGPYETISLEVLAGNKRAIAFYLKRGFIETANLDACGTALSVPTLVMTKSFPK